MIAILKPLIPWILYTALFMIAIYGATRRAQWALYLMIVLTPLPALWYPLHTLPFGKDTMDILTVAAFIGAYVNKDGVKSPQGSTVVWLFVVTNTLALLNVFMTFGLNFDTGRPIVAVWKNYTEMMILYFLAYSIFREEELQKTVIVMITVILLLIALREFRNFTAGASFSYEKRSSGPFLLVGLNPNHFAAFIAHFGCLVLGLLLVDKHKIRRPLYIFTALFCLHPLFFAYSRGAYLATVAVLFVYGVLKNRSLLVMLVILGFTWQVVLPDTVVDRITMTSNAEGQIEESAALRLILWEQAQTMFRENPIFGVGFNGFEYAMREHTLKNSHNFWVQTAAEQGIIGIACLAMLFMRAFWISWFNFRRGQNTFAQGVGLGFIGCTTAAIITNMFGDRFTQFSVGAYYFLVFGMAERIYANGRKALDDRRTQRLRGQPSAGASPGGDNAPPQAALGARTSGHGRAR